EAGKIGQDHIRRLLIKRSSIANSATMRTPVAAALVERHRGKRTLGFHERIADAARLSSLLSARNHNVTTYHSQLSPELRRDNLRLCRRGVFDVLVTCKALDEGADIPEVEVGIIASATASSRQRIQRLGRVLRRQPKKELATIYTIYVTDAE